MEKIKPSDIDISYSLKDKGLSFEFYRPELSSDIFYITKNFNNLSDKKIAQIINDIWYGKDNPLKFNVIIENNIKFIEVFEREYF